MAEAPSQVLLEISQEGVDAPQIQGDDLRRIAEALVTSELGPGQYALSLHLVDDDTIQALNHEHRDKDAPTDVLSFPLHDPTGMRFVLPPDQPVHLGDVVISVPRVQEQAHAYGHSFERELGYLFAHGVLHVLGYDHEEEADRQRMRTREEDVLERLGLRR